MAAPRKDRPTISRPKAKPKSKPKARPISSEALLEKERTHRDSEPEEAVQAKQKSRRKAGQQGEKRRAPAQQKRSSKPSARSKDNSTASQISSAPLSLDSLAKLDALNQKEELKRREKEREKEKQEEKQKHREFEQDRREKKKQEEKWKHQEHEREKRENAVRERVLKVRDKQKRRFEDGEDDDDDDDSRVVEKRKRRIVSGAIAEEGMGRRGGFLKPEGGRFGKGCWLLVGFVVLLLVILIPIGVLVIGKNNNGSNGGGPPANSNLNGVNPSDIPTSAKGSYFDPFTWYDTKDFNLTYTDQLVGGLPVMGLFSNWDDSSQANKYVPKLSDKFNYGQMPIRGINLGGWLSLEPFITPSLFNSYDSKLNLVDEYSLSAHLGPQDAAKTLEKHYSSFITEQDFIDIQAAGFDHVRIPFSYWAVTTYPGDPYVAKISWRYLLRGIEWARKHGLRVNLDLHAVPGSQNGWNHSGRQGAINWLAGTDGSTNGQRSLDIHGQLSTFFAQPRYKNVIGLYGLVNEPKMTVLPVQAVLSWTTSAIGIVRKNGITQTIVFADGFLGLPKWQGKLSGVQGLVMDAHQYVIFNTDQIAFDHKKKVGFACSGWSSQMKQSIDTTTG